MTAHTPMPIVPAARRRLARTPVHGIAVALLLGIPCAMAGAQPVPRPAPDTTRRAAASLPTVTVVGTTPSALSSIPGAAAVITGARLEQLAPLSIKEALRTVPGVHVVDEDAFGLNLNIGMRGLPPRRSSRILLLEDGMPIHLGPYSDPSAHYHPPVDALARIEVVKGSAQIAFGPQTIGGVVNFVRRPPPLTPQVRLALQGGSRGLGTARLSAGGTWNGRGITLDAARREGDGTRRDHFHRLDDLTLRGTMPLGNAQRVALTAGYYREASRYGEAGLSQTEFDQDPYQNPLPNDVFDLTRQALQGVHEVALGGGALLRTQAYAQWLDRTAWRQASTSADRLGNVSYERAFRCAPGATTVNQCGNTGRPRSYAFAGLEPRLTLPHAIGRANAVLETGVRLHDESMRRQERSGETATSRTGTLTRDNEIDTRAMSLFLREQLQLGQFTLTPGVRVEQVRSVNVNRLADTENRDRYTEVLPGLGVSWAAATPANLTIIAGVHRGFAPPRPADVLNPVPGEGLVQVDAEVSWTSELGARMQLGKAMQVDVTAFRIDFDNQVVSGSLVGSGQRFVNAGRTLHQGIEVGASLAIDQLPGMARWPTAAGALTLDAAWTFLPTAKFSEARASTVDAQQSVLGRRVPFAPRNVLHAGLGWSRNLGASVRLDTDLVSSQFADDLNTIAPSAQGRRGQLPAYAVFNASARIPLRAVPSAPVFTASVKNLFDRVYITDRQEGIMTGMPRLVLVGFELAMDAR